MSFGWMRWTLPSAYFFVSIVVMLIFLALYDEISPGYPRKGLLPIETTRGDRVFISLLALGSTVFIWLGALPPFQYGGQWRSARSKGLSYCVGFNWKIKIFSLLRRW